MIKEIDDKIYKEYQAKFDNDVNMVWEIYRTHKFIPRGNNKYVMYCLECNFEYRTMNRNITKINIYNLFNSGHFNYLNKKELPKCSEYLMENVLK